MTDNSARVIALDKERMQAMVDQDAEKLRNMICKGLVYTHSSARLDTKESLIGNMESGARSTKRALRRRLKPKISVLQLC